MDSWRLSQFVSFILIGVWLLAPAGAAYLASRKGRSGLGWAGLCFIFPFIAFALNLALALLLHPRGQKATWLIYGVWVSGLIPLVRLYFLPSKEKQGDPTGQATAGATYRKSASLKWLIVLMALLTPVGSVYVFIIRPFLPVTRKGAYARVLQKSDDYYRDLLSHFPRGAQPGVHLVQFYHQPKVLQGGATWIARFKADHPSYVESVLALHPPRAVLVFEDMYATPPGPKTLSPEQFQMSMQYQWEMISRILKTKSEDLTPFYASYQPLLLSQRVANHGHASGIFVSRERSEVIYWATKG